MKKRENQVLLQCDCKCCMLVVERIEWDDNDIDYSISIQDSRYDHNYNTIWGRIKRAASALFGKPVYFNDLYITEPEKFAEWVSAIEELIAKDSQSK